jgi:hypothetical protein
LRSPDCARSRGARRSDHDARQYPDRRVCDAVDRGAAGGGPKYVKAHDGLLLANHGALALAGDVMSAYYRMETIEHFAKISLVARTLGRENILSRDEVERLQGLRGMYGIASPAPICTDDSVPSSGGQLDCQEVQRRIRMSGSCPPNQRILQAIGRICGRKFDYIPRRDD